MEPEFIRGAANTLTRERPVLFAEAGTAPELRAVMDVLAPLGYYPTGRVFNATATYEFRWVSTLTRLRQWLRRRGRGGDAVGADPVAPSRIPEGDQP